jgi:signal peptidase I
MVRGFPALPENLRLSVGPSMEPTLKPGDLVSVEPYGSKRPARGDVIVFRPPGEDRYITHRIQQITPEGIIARGDNNRSIDPWMLRSEDIMGRVVAVERRGATRRVRGGRTGRIRAFRLHCVRSLRPLLAPVLSPFYKALSRSRCCARLVPLRQNMRVISLERKEGRELQLLLGRTVVGRLPPNHDQWLIRRPFRLFVDEKTLPGP